MADENLGRAVLALTTDDKGLDKGLGDSERKAEGWVKRVGGALGTGLAVGAGVAVAAGAALTAVLADSVKEAMAAELVQADLAAVLESTGGKAGVTADMANDLANALSEVTRFEDDTILAGENMLLTFTNIGKDVFPMATEAMLNMAQKMHTDPEQAAIQLGKALNDPIAGISALTRVGVTFTEQQKEQIKAMVEAGDTAGAQKLILKELETEFGGAAKAAGKTFAGQMDILNHTLGNVKEEIGGALIPVLSDLATEYGPELTAFAKEAAQWIKNDLVPAIKDVVAWLKVYLPPAIDFLVTVWNQGLKPVLQWTWSFIFDDLIPAISALIDWLGPKIGWTIDTAKGNFNSILGVIGNVKDAFDGLMGKVKGVADVVGGAFNDAVGSIKGHLNSIIDAINAAIGSFNSIAGFLGLGTLDYLPHLARGVVNWPGGVAMVGERGPEPVFLPRGSGVLSNSDMRNALSNQNTRNLTLNIYSQARTEDVVGQFALLEAMA